MTDAEEAAARDYLTEAGYAVLKGCLSSKTSYREAQNNGRTITETRHAGLNIKADALIDPSLIWYKPMADASKFKARRLGPPPAFTDVPGNLRAPETAPVSPVAAVETARPIKDGRSARRTGRTFQFSTRVTMEFNERFRAIAERDKLQMNELLEKALNAYESVKG